MPWLNLNIHNLLLSIVASLYRDRIKSVHQVWWIMLSLLLLITSAPACLQHSGNLMHRLKLISVQAFLLNFEGEGKQKKLRTSLMDGWWHLPTIVTYLLLSASNCADRPQTSKVALVTSGGGTHMTSAKFLGSWTPLLPCHCQTDTTYQYVVLRLLLGYLP